MNNLLDTRQLNVFTTLARLGNMRKAGQELNLTASAVSHTLKSLEEELGCSLFDRTSRKVELTVSGEKLLNEAEDILVRLEAARHMVHSWSDWRKGRLRIGASPTACQYILPAAIREFKESFPGITLQIEQANGPRLMEIVGQGKVDLSIQPAAGATGDDVSVVELGEDELAFLLNPLHPWAQKGRVVREEIVEQRFILTGRNTNSYELISDYFRPERINILPFIEISNEAVIKQLVELDIGIGIFPTWVAAKEINEGLLVALPLGRRKLRRRWVMYSNKRRQLNFAESLFVGIARTVARNLFSGWNA